MTDLIPGTALAKSLQTGESAFAAIEPILTATGGLTLAQVEGLTGLNGSTIQNWVKRGWVAAPVGKRYGRRQLMRIILINMLRAVMKWKTSSPLCAISMAAWRMKATTSFPTSSCTTTCAW